MIINRPRSSLDTEHSWINPLSVTLGWNQKHCLRFTFGAVNGLQLSKRVRKSRGYYGNREIVDRGKSGTVNANGVFFTPSSSILALRTESLSSNEGTHLETCHLGIGFGLIGQTRACKHIDRKDPYPSCPGLKHGCYRDTLGFGARKIEKEYWPYTRWMGQAFTKTLAGPHPIRNGLANFGRLSPRIHVVVNTACHYLSLLDCDFSVFKIQGADIYFACI
ncbi:hypothetical protein WG66_014229 [Moniliophthora roreri]|nr:hypothetical protein WG66_014229 [Moniliophthora roreri]